MSEIDAYKAFRDQRREGVVDEKLGSKQVLDYGAHREKRKRREASTAARNVAEAGNPDENAANDELARDFKEYVDPAVSLPRGLIESQKDTLTPMIERGRAAQTIADSPMLTRWLANDENARVASDDLLSLAEAERKLNLLAEKTRGFNDAVSGAFKRGWIERPIQVYNQWNADAKYWTARHAFNDKTWLDRFADFYDEGRGDSFTYDHNWNVAKSAFFATAAELDALLQKMTGATRAEQIRLGSEYQRKAAESAEKARGIPYSAATKGQLERYAGDGENPMTLMKALSITVDSMINNPGAMFAMIGELGLESAGSLLPAMTVSLASRNPGLTWSTLGATSYLTESTLEHVNFFLHRGYDLTTEEGRALALANPELMEEAARRGHIRGLYIGGLDMVSGGVASKALAANPALDAALQMIVHGSLGAAGEGLAQYATDGEVHYGDVLIEGLAEFSTAPIDVALIGSRRLGDRKRRAADANARVEAVQEMSAAATASATRERAPEKFREFVEAAAAGSGVETMYFPADEFMVYFQEQGLGPEEIAEQLPGVSAEQIKRAMTTGEDITLPTATYMERVAGSDLDEFVMAHVKFSPDDMTPTEAKLFNEGEELEEAQVAAKQDIERTQADEADAIAERLTEELVAAGRPREAARREAELYPAFYRTLAKRMGKPLGDVMKAYKAPRVRGVQNVKGDYEQAIADLTGTPQFKAWSGGKGIMDGETLHEHDFSRDTPGEYRVMAAYHGSVRKFDSFDQARKRGSIFGFIGRMNYFSSSFDDTYSNYIGGGPDHEVNVDKDGEVLADLILEELERLDTADLTVEDETPRIREAVENMLANPELPEKFRNIDIDAIDDSLFETNGYYADGTMAQGLGEDISRNQIHKAEGPQTYNVYIRTKNPLVVSDKVEEERDESEYDELDEDEDGEVDEDQEPQARDGDNMFYDLGPELGAAWREAVDKAREEIDATDPETRTEYPLDMTVRVVGQIEHPFVDTLKEVARQYEDVDVPRYLYDFIVSLKPEEIKTGKVSHNSLFRALWNKNAAKLDDEMAGVDMTAEIIKALGYDAIILKGAENQFSDMRMPPNTTHIMTFDRDAGNIKSNDNDGGFDPTSPNIFEQDEVDINSPEFKAWAKTEFVQEPDDANEHDFIKAGTSAVRVWHGNRENTEGREDDRVQVMEGESKGGIRGYFGANNYLTTRDHDAEGYASAEMFAGGDLNDPDMGMFELVFDAIEDVVKEAAPTTYEELGTAISDGMEAAIQVMEKHNDDETDSAGHKIHAPQSIHDRYDGPVGDGRYGGVLEGLIRDEENWSAAQDIDSHISAATQMFLQDIEMENEGTVYEMFVRMDNPFVVDARIGDNFVDRTGRMGDWRNVGDAEAQLGYQEPTDSDGLTQGFHETAEVVNALEQLEIAKRVDDQTLENIKNRIQGSSTADDRVAHSAIDGAVRESSSRHIGEIVSQLAAALGYDAIVFRNVPFVSAYDPGGTVHIHVLDRFNTNIKSAENRGTFDPTNPNIYEHDDLPDDINSLQFKRWARTMDPPIESEDAIDVDFNEKKARAFNVFHTSTSKEGFTMFETEKKGNATAYFGLMNYFSTSAEDSYENYGTGLGPPSHFEQAVADMEGALREALEGVADADQYNQALTQFIENMKKNAAKDWTRGQLDGVLKGALWTPEQQAEYTFSSDEVVEYINSENLVNDLVNIHGEDQAGHLFNLFVRVENPFVISDHERKSEPDQKPLTHDVAVVVKEVRNLPDGTFTDEDARADVITDLIARAENGEITHDDIESVLNQNAWENYFPDVVKALGYDSVILRHANRRFGHTLEMGEGTVHIQTFPEDRTAIKSATDNSGEFNPNNANIYEQDYDRWSGEVGQRHTWGRMGHRFTRAVKKAVAAWNEQNEGQKLTVSAKWGSAESFYVEIEHDQGDNYESWWATPGGEVLEGEPTASEIIALNRDRGDDRYQTHDNELESITVRFSDHAPRPDLAPHVSVDPDSDSDLEAAYRYVQDHFGIDLKRNIAAARAGKASAKARALADKQVLDPEQTPEFEAWKRTRDNPIKGTDINSHDFTQPGPHVLEVYHSGPEAQGIQVFDMAEHGGDSNSFGRVNYFSSSKADTERNYKEFSESNSDAQYFASEVSTEVATRLTPLLSKDATDEDWRQVIVDAVNEVRRSEAEIGDVVGADEVADEAMAAITDDMGKEDRIVKAAAAAAETVRTIWLEVNGSSDAGTLKLYVRTENPFVIGGPDSRAKTVAIKDLEAAMQRSPWPMTGEIADLNRSIEAVEDMSGQGRISHMQIFQRFMNNWPGAVRAGFAEDMGFDAIILKDAGPHFGMQSTTPPKTTHVMVFDEKNTNIKSAEFNSGMFDRSNPNIYEQDYDDDVQADFDSAAFRSWTQTDRKPLSGTDIDGENYGQPGPFVFEVWHGTTHGRFNKFTPKVKGTVSSYFGRINYFTSDSYDAEKNYTQGGGDLKNRIDVIREELGEFMVSIDDAGIDGKLLILQESFDTYDIDNDSIIEINQYVNREIKSADAFGSMPPETVWREAARMVGEAALNGGESRVQRLYVRMMRPFVLDYNDESGRPDTEEVMVSIVDEAGDNPVLKALADQGVPEDDIEAVKDDLVDADAHTKGEIGSMELYRILDENLGPLEDEEGYDSGAEAIGEVIQALGFDGIIMKGANRVFPQLGMSPHTTHVMVFDEHENSIKSGASKAFDPNNPDIYEQNDPVGYTAFTGGRDVIEPDKAYAYDYTEPGPHVARVWNGSTKMFDEFDAEGKAWIAGFFGKVSYFSGAKWNSDNYTGNDKNQDLKARIQSRHMDIANAISEHTNIIQANKTPDPVDATLEAFDAKLEELVGYAEANKAEAAQFRQDIEDARNEPEAGNIGAAAFISVIQFSKAVANWEWRGDSPNVREFLIRMEKPYVLGGPEGDNNRIYSFEPEKVFESAVADWASNFDDVDNDPQGMWDDFATRYDQNNALNTALWKNNPDLMRAIHTAIEYAAEHAERPDDIKVEVDLPDGGWEETSMEEDEDAQFELMLLQQITKRLGSIDALEVSNPVGDSNTPAKGWNEGYFNQTEFAFMLLHLFGDIREDGSGDRMAGHLAMLTIQALGYDSIIIKDVDPLFWGTENREDKIHYHMFHENRGNIKSATDNDGSYDRSSPNVYTQDTPPKKPRRNPRGNITLPKDGSEPLIQLFERANLSTFLHESGHFFLSVLTDVAARKDAPPDVRQMVANIQAWWRENAKAVARDGRGWWKKNIAEDGAGAPTAEDVINYLEKGTTGDHRKDTAIDVGAQEQFVRGFETYIMEGKAPTSALRAAFEQFRSWLLEVYKHVKGDLDVKINDDLRKVFDMMLAVDEEIENARSDNLDEMLSKTAAELGIDEAEYARLVELHQEARDQAAAATIEKGMRPLKKMRIKGLRTIRGELGDEVEREVNAQPVYRAIEFMGNKRWIGDEERPTAVPGDLRISREQLIERYGEDFLRRLPRGTFRVYTPGGMDIDEAAGWFGFDSGDAMIQAMVAAPRRKVAIERELERRALMEAGRQTGEQEAAQEATKAQHVDKRGDYIAAELRTLYKHIDKDTRFSTASYARQVARKTIAGMQVREAMASRRFLAAERRAAEAAQRAFAKGDREGAADAKRRQLINHMLFSESEKVADEVGKTERLAKRLQRKGTRKNLANEYLGAIDDVLAQYDFRKISRKEEQGRQRLLAYVAMMQEQGREGELAIPDHVLDGARPEPYKTLTVERLRGVRDTLKNIENTARRAQKLIDAQGERDMAAVVADIERAFRKTKRRTPGRVATKGEAARRAARQYLNLGMTADTILRELDGFPDQEGAVYKHIKRGVDLANNRATTRRREVAERLEKLYDRFPKKQRAKMTVARKRPELGGVALSDWDLIAIAMNMGNADNIQRLTDPRVRGAFTWEQLNAMVDAMPKEYLDFVQESWNYIDSFYDEIAKRELRMTGVIPEKVEAVPLETAHGTYRGGYYPIKYDPRLSDKVADESADELMNNLRSGRFGKAQTRNGHLKGRMSSSGRPVLLDLGVFHMHLNQVLHDLEYAETVAATWRILNNHRVRDIFIDYGRQTDHEALMAWIQDTATGQMMSNHVVDRFSRRLKAGFTISKLAFNMSTVAIQLTGITHSMVAVGKANFIRGLGKYLTDPVGTSKRVVEASAFMQERQSTFNKDIHDIMGDIKVGPAASPVHRAMQEFIGPMSFWLMQKVQFHGVDMPTWLAAFEAGLRKGLDEKEAALQADRAVARAQASGLFSDRSPIERGTISPTKRQYDFIRLFTALGSYMFAKGNLAYSRTRATDFTKPGQVLNWTSDMALLFIVEAILYNLIRGSLPDEEDEDSDGWLAFLAKEGIFSVLGTLPFIRDFAGGLRGYGAGGPYGSVGDTLARPFVQVGQVAEDGAEALDIALLKSFVDALGMTFYLPATQTNRIIDGIYRSNQGDDVAVIEYIMGKR